MKMMEKAIIMMMMVLISEGWMIRMVALMLFGILDRVVPCFLCVIEMSIISH